MSLDGAEKRGCIFPVGNPVTQIRFLLCGALALIFALTQNAAQGAGPAPASLSSEAARARLEILGLPLGADTFARAVATRHRPLIDLCFAGHLEVNVADQAGRTPLLLAALHEDWESVRRLLNAGAAVEVADAEGVTPLMAAAMHGNVELLRAFIAREVSADVTDKLGRAALHYAVAAQQMSAIEFLLPFSANLTTPCADGRDVIALAYETNDAKIIEAVLERTPSNLEWTSGTRRALNAALRAASKDQIRFLLSKHRAPPTLEGRTVPLLAYAIVLDETPLFNILLASGADANTVLPTPCEKEFLALLPASYLRHYVEGDSGVTLLMLAAGLGKAAYVRTLLEAGANRNRATPKYKMLALYFATRTENWQCTQMLLGSGPSPDELRVEISLASQEAAVIKDGVTIFTTECSTGRKGFSTPAGRYVITDKNRDHRSTIYKVPMPFFMRLSCRDFGMHAGVVPDYPASHGCIRLPSAAARKLFAEIPVGTLVTIN